MFVRPQMSSDTAILPDSIGLKAAQPDKIKTIAYLLAQTVALHFYETRAPARLPAQSCTRVISCQIIYYYGNAVMCTKCGHCVMPACAYSALARGMYCVVWKRAGSRCCQQAHHALRLLQVAASIRAD